MTTPALSDKGTLLLKVPTEELKLKSIVTIDDKVFVPKAEHHITIFGYRTGRLLLATAEGDEGLRHRIEFLIRHVEWSWSRNGFFFELERDKPKPISTIIELVRVPVARFYEMAAKEVDAAKWPELSAALRSPPPPHITLYTTDKKGVDGIGVDSSDDLKLALNACAGTKFRARSLPGV